MIYGERLRLRATERADLPFYVTWLNDPEVRRYLLINSPLSMVQEERWFESMQNRPLAEQVLAIEVREGDGWRLIGSTSLVDVNNVSRSAEVGILIGDRSCWNRGYGRDTLRLMLQHGFEDWNLNRIFLHVVDQNLGAIKAYENAGFKHEGRLRQADFKNGRYNDLLVMAVLREEWTK